MTPPVSTSSCQPLTGLAPPHTHAHTPAQARRQVVHTLLSTLPNNLPAHLVRRTKMVRKAELKPSMLSAPVSKSTNRIHWRPATAKRPSATTMIPMMSARLRGGGGNRWRGGVEGKDGDRRWLQTRTQCPPNLIDPLSLHATAQPTTQTQSTNQAQPT